MELLKYKYFQFYPQKSIKTDKYISVDTSNCSFKITNNQNIYNYTNYKNNSNISFLGKDIFLTKIKPSRKSYLASTQKACEAHLKPKSDELYLSLTSNEQKIIDKFGISKDDVFSICGILRKKLSKYDTAMVIETRHTQTKQKLKNGDLKISNIHPSITDKIKIMSNNQMNCAKKEGKFIIITGRCGSGKTRIPKMFNYKKLGYYIPDADDIKPLLPNYQKCGAGYVQEASVELNTQNVHNALSKKVNTVLMTVGYKPYLENLVNIAKENGYKDIKLIHVDTSLENSIKRVLKRGLKSGRTVDPAIIEQSKYVDDIPNYNLSDMGFTSFEIYDNNGEKPVKIFNKIFK